MRTSVHELTNDSPFYLAVNYVDRSSLPIRPWFKAQPIGIIKLNRILKDMITAVNMANPEGKRLTNHSARKHLVQKLTDNNIPPTDIMQITGHKNIHSVNN